MREIDHKIETNCPFCGKFNSMQSRLEGATPPPKDGDVSICIGCGALSVFEGALLRKPTDRERLELSYDPEIQAAVQVWREMDMKRARDRYSLPSEGPLSTFPRFD